MQTSSLPLLVTIGLLIIIALFVAVGYHRGLFRTIVFSCPAIFALGISALLTPLLSNWLTNNTSIGATIHAKIMSLFSDKLGTISLPEISLGNMTGNLGSVTGSLGDVTDGLGNITNNLGNVSLPTDSLSNYANTEINNITNSISTSVSAVIIRIITYILISIIIFLAFRLLASSARLVDRLKVIGPTNRVLGAILGFFKAMMIIWFLCTIILLLSSTSLGASCLEVIRGSVVLSAIYNYNPIMLVFSFV